MQEITKLLNIFSHHGNKIDSRDLKVCGNNYRAFGSSWSSNFNSLATATMSANLFDEIPDKYTKDIGFILTMTIRLNVASGTIFMQVNGRNYSMDSHRYDPIVNIYKPDLSLYLYNSSASTIYYGYDLLYIPKSKYNPDIPGQNFPMGEPPEGDIAKALGRE